MSKTKNPRSGRVEQPEALLQVRTDKQPEFANDSLGHSPALEQPRPTKRPYVTKAKAVAIAMALGPRERVLLADVARLGVASADQLRRLHYDPSEAGRRLARMDLASLCEAQVLARMERTVGGVRAGSKGHCFTVGVAGQRIVWPERRRYREPWTPNPAYLRHALGVSELYVQLRTQMADRLLTYDTEPACWRSYSGPGGAPATLKPDAFAVLDLGRFEDRYFCEIDNATESGTRIVEKARAYIRYWQSGREIAASGVFPQVLWVTTTETRRDFMIGCLARLPAEHWQLFAVVTAAEATDRMTGGSIKPISNREEERS
jgi:hypothetical protein